MGSAVTLRDTVYCAFGINRYYQISPACGQLQGPYMGYHYHGLQGVNLVYLKINHSLHCSDKPIVPVVEVEASGTIAIAGKESTQEMPVRGLGVYLRATQ